MFAGISVFLGVIFGLLALALIAVLLLRQKLREISRSFFGTEDFREGLVQTRMELSTTPKTVNSMTGLMEPQIMRDFPDFSWPQYRSRAENLIVLLLQSISAGSVGRLSEDAGDELRLQVRNRIEDNGAAGITEVYEKLRVHQTEIANYRRDAGRCIITIQSAVEHIHYREQNGRLLDGSKELVQQTRYNLELVYIQDTGITADATSVGTACPNCGAPIRTLGVFRCEYCGLAVTPVNLKVWKFERFSEVDYRHV